MKYEIRQREDGKWQITPPTGLEFPEREPWYDPYLAARNLVEHRGATEVVIVPYAPPKPVYEVRDYAIAIGVKTEIRHPKVVKWLRCWKQGGDTYVRVLVADPAALVETTTFATVAPGHTLHDPESWDDCGTLKEFTVFRKVQLGGDKS